MVKEKRAIRSLDIMTSAGATSIVITTNSTVYTRAFYMGDGSDFAITTSFSAPALASCNVGLFLEQGDGFPLAEGAAQITAGTSVWVTVGTAAVSCAPINVWAHNDLTTMPLAWGRFKLVGITTNTGSQVSIRLHKTVEG